MVGITLSLQTSKVGTLLVHWVRGDQKCCFFFFKSRKVAETWVASKHLREKLWSEQRGRSVWHTSLPLPAIPVLQWKVVCVIHHGSYFCPSAFITSCDRFSSPHWWVCKVNPLEATFSTDLRVLEAGLPSVLSSLWTHWGDSTRVSCPRCLQTCVQTSRTGHESLDHKKTKTNPATVTSLNKLRSHFESFPLCHFSLPSVKTQCFGLLYNRPMDGLQMHRLLQLQWLSFKAMADMPYRTRGKVH